MSRLLVPRQTREALDRTFVCRHLGLALGQFQDDGVMENADLKRERYVSVASAVNGERANRETARALAKRQADAVAASGLHLIGAYKMKLRSNFVSGMSTPTLLENGMALLRPYGIPFIADSTVKGVIASWLAEVLSGKINQGSTAEDEVLAGAGLLGLFQKIEDQPPIVFFDALPVEWGVVADVTTPHHASWYQEGGNTAPLGVENPVPVYLLTVRSGSVFQFRFAQQSAKRAMPAVSAENWEKLGKFGIAQADDFEAFWKSVVKSTADYKGFGAKTGGGYGHMVEVS